MRNATHNSQSHTQAMSLTISLTFLFLPLGTFSASFSCSRVLSLAARRFPVNLCDFSLFYIFTTLSLLLIHSQESDTGVRSQMDISDEVQSILDKLNIARVQKCPTSQFWSVMETIMGSVMGSVCTMYSVQCTCHEVFRIAV